MRSFIVQWSAWLFGKLRWISICWVLRYFLPEIRMAAGFTEAWGLGHFLLSLLLLGISRSACLDWWEAVAVFYGLYRVFELFVYQVNVLFFDPYRASKEHQEHEVHGFFRLMVMLVLNYWEFTFWFALAYRNFDWAFDTSREGLNSFLGALNFSFHTMTTFGYTAISPEKTVGYVLTFLQSVVGVFMALLMLARFISLWSEPLKLDTLC